jgi:dihydrofolate reductase
MRKLQYFVACSIDGYIAHEDGSLDGFPAEGEHVPEFLASLSQFDTVLMGRKTYDVALKAGVTSPYPAMRQYLFSRSMRQSPDPQVELISENAVEVVRCLKAEEGKLIWLCGGADLAATLFAEKLIDEIVVKMNPFLLGSGIPLFARAVAQTDLDLLVSRVFGSGVVWLRYRVTRSTVR